MSTLPDEFFTIDFKIDAFVAIVKGLNQISRDGIGNILRGGNVDFVRNCQVYLDSRMQAALKQGGSLEEGQMATIRGQTWAGWAMHTVDRPEYGSMAKVGTRYYERKFARGAATKAAGGTWDRKTRAAMAGIGVASRPYEVVWNRRGKSARYSSSSKIMQNTGRLRASLILMDTRVNGNNIELRPGVEMPDYFPYQNYLRPLWVLEPAVDYPVIVGFAQKSVANILVPLTGGG